MRVAAACTVVFAFAAASFADEVFLVGGGRVTGVVVERNEKTIVLDVGAGRVALPLSRVERVVASRSALAAFRERAQSLAPDDLPGWLALAYWAQERSLGTPAREAFERVLRLDPQNAAAQAAVGNVQQDGRWMTPEESFKARGLVAFEGSWITPAERDSIRRDRREADADRRLRAERAEADARVREADARVAAAQAAAAEAEARRAEAEREAASFGGSFVSFSPSFPPAGPHCCTPTPAPTACPPGVPAASTPGPPRRTPQARGATKPTNPLNH